MWVALVWQVGLVIAGVLLTTHLAIDTVTKAIEIYHSWRIELVEKTTEKKEARTHHHPPKRPSSF
jgi:hypothetical protein